MSREYVHCNARVSMCLCINNLEAPIKCIGILISIENGEEIYARNMCVCVCVDLFTLFRLYSWPIRNGLRFFIADFFGVQDKCI